MENRARSILEKLATIFLVAFYVGCTLCVVLCLFVYFFGLIPLIDFDAWREENQALKEVQGSFDSISTPAETEFISEYATTTCCGNGNHHPVDLIVTRLYSSHLSKDEIRAHYQPYLDTPPQTPMVDWVRVNLAFVDEQMERYPNRRVNLPCDPYHLFSGHNIPAELDTEHVLYILYMHGNYTHLEDPEFKYCF